MNINQRLGLLQEQLGKPLPLGSGDAINMKFRTRETKRANTCEANFTCLQARFTPIRKNRHMAVFLYVYVLNSL